MITQIDELKASKINNKLDGVGIKISGKNEIAMIKEYLIRVDASEIEIIDLWYDLPQQPDLWNGF
jgi:hypothetical protein